MMSDGGEQEITPGGYESRVLILPQTTADAQAMSRLFQANGMSCFIAANTVELCKAIDKGAGAVLVTEEALIADSSQLIACVANQPVWSDLPVLVLSRSGRESVAFSRMIQNLGNVSVLERPVRTSTLVTLVRSSLRARDRQYQVRSYLLEQEQAQRVIRESDSRYRALIENISDYAVFMTDPEGRISTWNQGAESVLGYGSAEVLGSAVTRFLPADADLVAATRELQRACTADRSETAGWRVGKDDKALYAEIVVVPVHDELGELLGLAHFMRDVTTRHRVEMERELLLDSERAARGQAERASRTKDEFLATLSHELRTPLNSILGWTQVARKSRGLTEDIGNALSVIDRNARAQAQIIEDLLDMSSIISGKVRLDVQRLDLAAIINATAETVRPAAQAKGIRLQVVLDPMAGPVRGDPNRLQQVLWNLLTNAVKFTPRDGRVAVTLARVNSHLEVEVADNGEGIDSAFLPHVFDRFRQADASASRRHGGLGLGLSIVKQLVELHGGTISAKSPGAGMGSTFRVNLPVMATNLDSQEEEAKRQHPSRSNGVPSIEETEKLSLKGVHILVVDDEPDARALIHRLLVDCDARVSTAASAEEGIAAILQDTPDVLISDVGMPGEDGYSMIRRIRKLDQPFASVPAIALTAYARVEDRVKAIQTGYQLHLSKPVEPVELIAMVGSLVARMAQGSGERRR